MGHASALLHHFFLHLHLGLLLKLLALELVLHQDLLLVSLNLCLVECVQLLNFKSTSKLLLDELGLVESVLAELGEKRLVGNLLHLIHGKHELLHLHVISHLELFHVDADFAPAHEPGNIRNQEVPNEVLVHRPVRDELILQHPKRDACTRVGQAAEDELLRYSHACDDVLGPGPNLLRQHQRSTISADALVTDGER